MDELNQNVPAEETAEQERAMKCDNNKESNQKNKTPALFKAGIAIMCATSALSIGAIGACGFLGYKLYKNQKNNDNIKPENSMGSVVTNKQDTITISEDGYWVINGVKTSTKAKAENGTNGLSIVSATIVPADDWGITTQIMFILSDGTPIYTSPRTQVMSEHFYEASSMSKFIELRTLGVQKIKLINDITLSSALNVTDDVVIDLNKHTLTYSATNPMTVAENCSLTLKDGSVEFTGETGVSVAGANAELEFNKVNIAASAVVAETLEENASITLDRCTFQKYQAEPIFGSSPAARQSIGSLFVVKGSNANLEIKASKFATNRAIISASENAETINVKIAETELNTTAPVLDIDTDVVVPTLNVDKETINHSTITELNTTPITSGSFNVDPTELGAELAGETFNVNGSSVIAENFSELISIVESGSTITLIDNVEIAGADVDTQEARLYIDKDLTIDLNGYSINGNYGNGNNNFFVFRVRNNATLTINDSKGNGSITSYATTGAYALYVDGGTLVVNAGTITGNPTAVNVLTGKVVINGGTFISSDEDKRYVINCIDANYRNETAIVEINGGTFVDYNPSATISEGAATNFVTEGHYVVKTGNNYAVISGSINEVISNAVAGSTITLVGNVEIAGADVDTQEARLYIDKDLTIDLNGYSINGNYGNGDNNFFVFRVRNNATLTINDSKGNGSITAYATTGAYALYVDGGTLVVNAGTITGNPTAVNVLTGKVVINGGTFVSSDEDKRYVINCIDANYRNETAIVEINGGTFVDYNPSATISEGAATNFVVEGHLVYQVGDNYTVAPVSELVNIIKNNKGANIMLPIAYVVDSELTIDLNDCTLSLPTDTDGSGVFKVVEGGNLTINGNGTINGVGRNNYNMAIWVYGGKATINGGTYTNKGATGSVDPAHFDLLYVRGGELIINGGTFINETPQWTINLRDDTPGTIIVNGGTFVGYNPAISKTEPVNENNPYDANFVAEGHLVYQVGDNYTVAPVSELVNIIKNNKGANIMLPIAYVVDSELTIDLNDCTLSLPTDTDGSGVFKVVEGGNLTINGNGTINGVGRNNYNMAIWVYGGKATINGGTYTNKGATGSVDPAHFDLLYVRGGELIINGGTFINETPQWTLNLRDYTPGTIIVNGGTFVGYNPAISKTEPINKDNPYDANFVAEGHYVVKTGNSYVVVSGTLQEVIANAVAGSTITLVGNVEIAGANIDTHEARLYIDKDLTIDLNGYSINGNYGNGDNNFFVFRVRNNATLTINDSKGNGSITAYATTGAYALYVDGGTLVVNAGTITGNPTAVNVLTGKVVINGGTFVSSDEDKRYVINCIDANYRNETALVEINGGTFVDYNPSATISEGAATNFVAEGYKVVVDGNNYTVVAE